MNKIKKKENSKQLKTLLAPLPATDRRALIELALGKSIVAGERTALAWCRENSEWRLRENARYDFLKEDDLPVSQNSCWHAYRRAGLNSINQTRFKQAVKLIRARVSAKKTIKFVVAMRSYRALHCAGGDFEAHRTQVERVCDSGIVFSDIVDSAGGILLWRSTDTPYAGRYTHWQREQAAISGFDDSGYWARRVPATVTTVRQALSWLEPAEIKRARLAGKGIERQGDLYLVSTSREYPPLTLASHLQARKEKSLYVGLPGVVFQKGFALSAAGNSHGPARLKIFPVGDFGRHKINYYRAAIGGVGGRQWVTITHPEHKKLRVEGWNWKPIQQKALPVGRNRRQYRD